MSATAAEYPASVATSPDKNSDEAGPLLFLVGCPRSGTTLLQRMLDAHPLLTVANDTHFIPRALEKTSPDLVARVQTNGDVLLTPQLYEAVQSYHRFGRLGLSEQDVANACDGASSYRQFVARLYHRLADRNGKPHSGEKTPDYVRRMPLLHALFPRARFVHIIRDGRDTALSIRNWAEDRKGPAKLALWETEPLATAALWWRWLVATGCADGQTLGPQRYLEIRYETLVADAPATLEQICRFLELPFADEMLAFNDGRARSEPGLSAKSAWLPPTPGLRDWRMQMSDDEQALCQQLVGDLLDTLKYPASEVPPTAAIQRRSEECRVIWSQSLGGCEPEIPLNTCIHITES